MRRESDRVRRVDVWDLHTVPAAARGVLSPFTTNRFNLRRRRVVVVVVTIIGLPERVLIFTPGMP
jgi:hypothetical protein